MFAPPTIRSLCATLAAAGALTLGPFPSASGAPSGAPSVEEPPPPALDPGPVIDAGMAFLRDRIDAEPAALGFAWMLHRRFGLLDFSDAPDRYDAVLQHDGAKDAPKRGAVRLFRRMVAVDNAFSAGDVPDLETDWDRMTVRALYCDREPLPPDYGERLTKEAKRGGYHLTHAGMALTWLRDNGCPWPIDDETVSAWIDTMAALVNEGRPGDVAYEAAGVVRYLGYGDRLDPEFAKRIVEAQNEDGGWSFDEKRPESHWHPTLLALWALLEEFASAKLDRTVPQPGGPAPPPEPAVPDPPAAPEAPPAWTNMVASEDRLLALTNDLQILSRAIRNLEHPGDRARALFADSVVLIDIEEAASPTSWLESIAAQTRVFPTAAPATVPRADLRVWAPLLERVVRFDHAAFSMVRGDFVPDDPNMFQADVGFEGRAELTDGTTGWVRGKVTVAWEKAAGTDAWRIAGWRTDTLELANAPTAFFREVLAETLRDDELLGRARFSGHDEVVREFLGNEERKGDDFFPPAMDEHPGLAIVDLDRDGFDDIYVMPHWGRNIALRNRGDGTFEDVGARVGLDIDGHTAAAVFADFDNDGDVDAMLARTEKPSLYLQNHDGVFRDAGSAIEGELPRLGSSVVAADVDRDGLLDVYFSTYAVRRLTGEYFAKESGETRLLSEFVSPETSEELSRRLESGARVYDFPGPPNVLLKNLGEGRFRVETDSALATLANTYQSTFADYDDDGDADVYLANDFAPNHLFRNDGAGNFDDVTEETGTSDVGFGMGATWGDVDGDGREDLYVSNMFSKAGRRITARFEGIDPRVPKMARGNTLFRNREGRFEDLSGEPGGRQAQKAGWSWGGQFVDVDNDALLDLYVLSGYYTAPREFELPVDT